MKVSPLPPAALAWGTGLALGLGRVIPWEALGLLALGLLLLGLWLRLRRLPLWPLLLSLVLLTGLARGAWDTGHHQQEQAALQGEVLSVVGVVTEAPQPAGTASRFRLALQEVETPSGARPAQGVVLITTRASQELVAMRAPPYIRYGDQLRAAGVLQRLPDLPPGDFRDFLERERVVGVLSYPRVALLGQGQGNPVRAALLSLQQRLAGNLSRALPEPQASLAQGILLGQRREIPQALQSAFNATGTSHLLAISGLHIGIVLGTTLVAAQALLGRRRNLYLLPPFLALWGYALLSGLSPSAERAALMGSLLLVGMALGRGRATLPALGAAALVMTAADPGVVWDVSFQLSFAAMAGLALLAPRLEELALGPIPVEERGGATWVLRGLLYSLAPYLASLPLVAFYFHRVALLGVPATLLALPVLPALLITSALTAVGGSLGGWIGQATGWLAWPWLTYLQELVRLLSYVPGSALSVGDFSGLLMVLYYGGLGLLLWAPRAGRGLPFLKGGVAFDLPRLRLRWLLPPLATGVLVLWALPAALPDGRLHVTFLDVGQGDAILIQGPKGNTVLVDGGPDPKAAELALGRALPFWRRSVDLVVLTHPHDDHVVGLVPVLQHRRVVTVLERSWPDGSVAYRQWRQALEGSESRAIQASQGQLLTLGGGVTLQVLNPPGRVLEGTSSDIDNSSVVLLIRYGRVGFLLTGDIHGETESMLLAEGLLPPATVLKVAHHGSRFSTTPPFLEAVEPQVAVISAGAENPFGHPHQETVEILVSQLPRDRILLTRDHGSIHMTTDGQRLWVQTER